MPAVVRAEAPTILRVLVGEGPRKPPFYSYSRLSAHCFYRGDLIRKNALPPPPLL